MKRHVCLAAIAAASLLSGPASADTSVLRTGPNGGTYEATRDCTDTGAAIECSKNRAVNGPGGRAWASDRAWSGSSDGITSTKTVTAGDGTTWGRTRSRTGDVGKGSATRLFTGPAGRERAVTRVWTR